MQTSNLFRLKKGYEKQQLSAGGHDMNEADSQLECLMLQKDALHIYPSISINYWQGLTELRSAILRSLACLPAVATNIFSSSKSRQDSKNLFFKTKQQEFIHPLILSPTHANKIDENPKKSSLFSILFFLAKRIVELTISNQIKKA